MTTHNVRALCLAVLSITFLTSVTQSDEKPAAKEKNKQIRVPAPLKKPWVLAFNDAGFRVLENKVHEDGSSSHCQAINADTRLSVGVYMEAGQAKTDTAKTVRDAWWGQTRKSYKVEDVKLWEGEDAAFVAYTRTDIAGRPVHQRNLQAFFARDGIWVDLKVSKLQFRADDLPEMEAVLKSASFQTK